VLRSMPLAVPSRRLLPNASQPWLKWSHRSETSMVGAMLSYFSGANLVVLSYDFFRSSQYSVS
jgi:hypothetical protein